MTVTSDIGRVTLNKNDLLFKTVGSKETLTASVALESGGSVPITWVSSNPGVATVDPNGVVTAVAAVRYLQRAGGHRGRKIRQRGRPGR